MAVRQRVKVIAKAKLCAARRGGFHEQTKNERGQEGHLPTMNEASGSGATLTPQQGDTGGLDTRLGQRVRAQEAQAVLEIRYA